MDPLTELAQVVLVGLAPLAFRPLGSPNAFTLQNIRLQNQPTTQGVTLTINYSSGSQARVLGTAVARRENMSATLTLFAPNNSSYDGLIEVAGPPLSITTNANLYVFQFEANPTPLNTGVRQYVMAGTSPSRFTVCYNMQGNGSGSVSSRTGAVLPPTATTCPAGYQTLPPDAQDLASIITYFNLFRDMLRNSVQSEYSYGVVTIRPTRISSAGNISQWSISTTMAGTVQPTFTMNINRISLLRESIFIISTPEDPSTYAYFILPADNSEEVGSILVDGTAATLLNVNGTYCYRSFAQNQTQARASMRLFALASDNPKWLPK